MIDKDILKESLSVSEVANIIAELGYNDEPQYNNKGLILNTCLCHGGNSNKLYYYDNKHLFHCYTGCNANFDIFQLTEKVKKIDFPEAVQWVAELVGRKPVLSGDTELISDWKWIKKLKRKMGTDINDEPYDKGYLDVLFQVPHKDFFDEGISCQIQNFFDVGFDIESRRITIPIYSVEGELMGLKGRIIRDLENDERYIKTKYLALLPYNKNRVLYGLHRTLPYVEEAQQVIVFEAEKSVMKAFQYGICNCVSIGGHELSINHIRQLIKLGSEVIIAFDRDLKDEEKVYAEIIEAISPFTRLSIIYDTDKLLDYKQAPVDKSKEIFEQLYNERQRINW